MGDFVAFLANPGDLAHGANRTSPEYVRNREDEFLFFCERLRTQFGKQLSGDDFKRVKSSDRVGWEGATPLHIAACYRHPDVLRHMLWDNLEAQSALNQCDALGRTVLDWATQRPKGKSRTNILDILEKYGAKHGTGISAARTTHRSITRRDINLTRTGRSGIQVPALDLTSAHHHTMEDAAQASACIKQIQHALKEQAAIEQKFKLLQQGIEKSLRLPEQVHIELKRKAAEYRQRFIVTVGASQEHQTRQQLEAQFGALRARNDALRTGMEALRQEYIQAQIMASSLAASANRPVSTQARREESSDSASENGLYAENVNLVASEQQLMESANPDISTEHSTFEQADGAANSKAQLIEEYQGALHVRASCRADYRTMKAQIEVDTRLGETERNSLLTSIQHRTTALQDGDDLPTIDQLSTDALEKRLAGLKSDNTLLNEGLENLRIQREKLAATPRNVQLSPDESGQAALQPALLAIKVADLRLLTARIASDSKIPPDAQDKLTKEARRALSNPFLQTDPQRISQLGNPAQKKWATAAQAHAHAELNKISSRIYDQYERARSGEKVELDWNKTRRHELITLVTRQTRNHLTELRRELQPIAIIEKKAGQFRSEMSEMYGLASEALHQPINSAPRDLPQTKSALSKLASALNQRLVRRLPWMDIQKTIDATINWSTQQNAPVKGDMEELSLLKRQLAYQTQLNEVSRLLAEPQNEGVIHEHRNIVDRCATYLKEVVVSLEKLSNAHSKLGELAQRSEVAARAAELQRTASELRVTQLDSIISRELNTMADLRHTDTIEPSMEALRDICKKVSNELKHEANEVEALYSALRELRPTLASASMTEQVR